MPQSDQTSRDGPGPIGPDLDHMPRVSGVAVGKARLADVCAQYGIAPLRVFGSVARGTATPDSDIDVLYELEPGRRLGRLQCPCVLSGWGGSPGGLSAGASRTSAARWRSIQAEKARWRAAASSRSVIASRTSSNGATFPGSSCWTCTTWA